MILISHTWTICQNYMSNLIDLIFSNRPNISLLSIKGENLITWWWSAQNSYMQARVTYLSGKSFLCEVWDTFIFFKEIKKLITIYYINTSYYHLDVYIIMQTWSPHFFFFENLFFSYSHISILKLPHPCFLTDFVECRNNDKESFNFSTVANLWGEIISRDNLSHQT